jgi:arylsulfatase A-like enzyme
MRLSRGAFICLFVLSIIAVGSLGAGPQQGATGPSVLLITLDTTRADKLGCYGNRSGLTPNLDSLASAAVLFEHCYTPIPETVPAHTSILSGWYPLHHGLRKNLDVRLAKSVPMIQEEYRAAGYETGAFVSSFVLLGKFGLSRGFNIYDTDFYAASGSSSVERSAEATLARAKSWIMSRKGRWFCWIHLYDPHFPYAPPEPYASKFASSPYDGEIAYMDSAIGKFFKDLSGTAEMSRTIIVICGDHGEALGEHGELEHGIFLYDCTTRVPLLLMIPGKKQAVRVAEPVCLIDVVPTLRELCGLGGGQPDGVSLLPLIKGNAHKPRPIFLESLEPFYSFGWAPLYGAVEDSLKYVAAPRAELYSLDVDPNENANLIRSATAAALHLKDELSKHFSGGGETVSQEKLALSDEELDNLRSLGYLGGTPGATVRKNLRDPKDCTRVLKSIWEGMRIRATGNPREAARCFEEALKQDPENPSLYLYLGECYEGVNDKQAINSLRKAILIRPDYSQAYVRLMSLLVGQGSGNEAYLLGISALKNTEDLSGMTHLLMAWAAFLSSKSDSEVTRYLVDGEALGGSKGLALKLRAALALRRGDKDQAIRYLEEMASVTSPRLVSNIGTETTFSALRDDARFWQIVLTAQNRANER